jgi:hypothetical protein
LLAASIGRLILDEEQKADAPLPAEGIALLSPIVGYAIEMLVGANEEGAAVDGRCSAEVLAFAGQTVHGKLLELVAGFEDEGIAVASEVIDLPIGHDR